MFEEGQISEGGGGGQISQEIWPGETNFPGNLARGTNFFGGGGHISCDTGHGTFVRLKKSKIGFVRQNFLSAGHFVRWKIFIAT